MGMLHTIFMLAVIYVAYRLWLEPTPQKCERELEDEYEARQVVEMAAFDARNKIRWASQREASELADLYKECGWAK